MRWRAVILRKRIHDLAVVAGRGVATRAARVRALSVGAPRAAAAIWSGIVGIAAGIIGAWVVAGAGVAFLVLGGIGLAAALIIGWE